MPNADKKIEVMHASLEDSLVRDVETWRRKVMDSNIPFNALKKLNAVRFTQRLTEDDIPSLLLTNSGKMLIARTVLLSHTTVFIFYDAFFLKDKTILLVAIPHNKKDLLPEERHSAIDESAEIMVVNGGVLNLSNYVSVGDSNIHTPEEFIRLAYVQAELREKQSTEGLLLTMCEQMHLDNNN